MSGSPYNSKFRFTLKDELVNHGGFLRVHLYDVINDSGAAFSLVNVERGDSVAALIHIETSGQNSVRLVEQFRLPVALRDGGRSTFVELPAVAIRTLENCEQAIARLCDIEGDVEVIRFEKIRRFFPSPGACSEAVSLYYVLARPRPAVKLDSHNLIPVRRFDLPLEEFLDGVASGSLEDSKCIAAAEWISRASIMQSYRNA